MSLTASCCLSTSQESCTLQFWGYRKLCSSQFGWEKGNITDRFAVWRRRLPILCCPLLLIFSSRIHRRAFQVLLLTYQYPVLGFIQAYLCFILYSYVQNIDSTGTTRRLLSIFGIHELAFFHLAMLKCQSARFDESPDGECWRDQNLPQRLVLGEVGESIESSEQGNPSPKNGIKLQSWNFNIKITVTFPKLTILPEIRGLGKQPSFWKQHFSDSYGFIAGLKF